MEDKGTDADRSTSPMLTWIYDFHNTSVYNNGCSCVTIIGLE